METAAVRVGHADLTLTTSAERDATESAAIEALERAGFEVRRPVAPPAATSFAHDKEEPVLGVRPQRHWHPAGGGWYPAFGVLLSPILASAAMAFSSVSVVGNSLRLRPTRIAPAVAGGGP